MFNSPVKLIEFLSTIDGLTKSEIEQKQTERFKKIFGNVSGGRLNFDNSLDDYYQIIKEAKKMDGYLARALSQISQKALKNGWSFHSENQKNIKVIEKRFHELLTNSNLNARSFLRDVVKNCVSYSNAFCLKSYNSKSGKKK